MKPGIYPQMSRADYDAIPAMNYSTLKHMRRSPAAYRWHKDHPQKQTPAMALGHAAHQAILEPDMARAFAVWEGGRRAGKEWESFRWQNEGRTILTKDEFEYVCGLRRAVHKCDVLPAWESSEFSTEVSLLWEDAATRSRLKGRIDLIADDRIYDVKTCVDCRPFGFEKVAFNLGYHIQAAMYQDGYYALSGKLLNYYIIAAESKPPHEVAVYKLPHETLQAGADERTRLILRVQECEMSRSWPGACESMQELRLPAWALEDDAVDLVEIEHD